MQFARRAITTVALGALLAGCSDNAAPSGPAGHVILIDIDDHGLAGLWMANAPNLKGLIARGTLAYSRVIVPTHSNQSNIALLSGQYPEGNNVPANSWLSRSAGFTPPVSFPGLAAGDYTQYDVNPLLTRGDSAYRAVARAHGHTAYVGELPPFDAGAEQVHLPIVGEAFGAIQATPDVVRSLMEALLHYPTKVLDGYAFDGPPDTGETRTRFTMRDAAAFIRANAMPAFMFVWDFIALDEDPTSSGANSDALVKIVEDYDAGLGEILAALDDKHLTASTNIMFTLDHGKVDTHQQVALGSRGGGGTMPADGQLAAVVAAKGGPLGISAADYAVVNEDGDAQIYARVDGAGTSAGAARQAEVAHALLSLIQAGGVVGLDVTRTMTADGAMGTRKMHDFHGSSPNQADILVFPQDDWTLNQVDAANTQPGPFLEHTQGPYGRHGGFSPDELYVPLIMAGPAFKSGAIIPHPVAHPQVPATALAALGVTLATAEAPAISAALVGNSAEAPAQPASLPDARPDVLASSGFGSAPAALAGAPATAAVIVDVAGLYDDELFADGALAVAAGPIRDFAARGTRFQDFWTRSRDWPVTEYEMLVGGYPVTVPWTPSAEEDPAQQLLPGAGLLQMPPAARFVANQGGFDMWRQPTRFADESLFDAAHALGLTTALVGQADFHDLHLDGAQIDVRAPASDIAAATTALADVLAQHPKALVVVAVGGARAADRHSAAAKQELGTIASDLASLLAAAGDGLVVLTSRGATPIDDPGADFYGPGSSHHVPFVLVGPNVRAGVVSSQLGTPADLPATVLFALGAPSRTDFADGTWAAGTSVAGVPQPTPKQATGGHALLRAFVLAP
jgi:arylsulfatase A-like enzyme